MHFRSVTKLPPLFCDYRNFSEPLAKIIFCTDCEDRLLSVASALHSHALADGFDFIRSERSLFEILPKGINKSISIERLAEHLHLDRHNTVAIGDYDNDAAMLRGAGCGIAVANASRAAMDAADLVTVSNEEHAIAKVINDLACGAISLPFAKKR